LTKREKYPEEDDHSSTGWGDAAVICPWELYLAYGDMQILKDQYTSMYAWVEYIKDKAQDGLLWNKGFHFGDWLFYCPDDDRDGRAAVTDKYLIAQCFYAHSTQLLIKAAEVLGEAFAKAAVTKGYKKVSFDRGGYMYHGRVKAFADAARKAGLEF
jgi:alpha-L-rhamnosidase